jgi:hypothetical protein
MLKNKANIWKTNDTLNLVDIEGTFFIRNLSSNNMLSIKTKDNYSYDVLNEIVSETNRKQWWEKRNPDKKSCFIISNPLTEKVLTATFEGLKAIGNYRHRLHSSYIIPYRGYNILYVI